MRIVSPLRFGIFIASTITIMSSLIAFAINPTVATVPEGEMHQAYPDYLNEYKELKSDSVVPLKIISEPKTELYTVTAYCSCSKCCGEWADKRVNDIVIGAWGKELTEDYSIASPLPFGTKVKIEGLGVYEVQDRTATWIADKYNGKVIDIYFGSNHEKALEFGRQILEVEIVDY